MSNVCFSTAYFIGRAVAKKLGRKAEVTGQGRKWEEFDLIVENELFKFYKHERKLALKNLRSRQQQQLIQNKKSEDGDEEKEKTMKKRRKRTKKSKNI